MRLTAFCHTQICFSEAWLINVLLVNINCYLVIIWWSIFMTNTSSIFVIIMFYLHIIGYNYTEQVYR